MRSLFFIAVFGLAVSAFGAPTPKLVPQGLILQKAEINPILRQIGLVTDLTYMDLYETTEGVDYTVSAHKISPAGAKMSQEALVIELLKNDTWAIIYFPKALLNDKKAFDVEYRIRVSEVKESLDMESFVLALAETKEHARELLTGTDPRDLKFNDEGEVVYHQAMTRQESLKVLGVASYVQAETKKAKSVSGFSFEITSAEAVDEDGDGTKELLDVAQGFMLIDTQTGDVIAASILR